MTILLFVLSVGSFLGGLGLVRDGDRTGAMCLYLVATILFSAAAIVGAMDGIGKRLAKRSLSRAMSG
jgi:hypothetical protein